MPLASFIIGQGRGDVLAAACSLAAKGVFVEVGTFRGEFAERLCVESKLDKLNCVDPYESYTDYSDTINTREPLDAIYHEARGRMDRFGDRVEFIRAYSANAAARFADGSLDFVYIDANHSFRFVYEDLCLWYPKLKAGGLMCGDDALDTDERQRNLDGNVEIAWQRDANGSVTMGAEYGVLKAVRTFCSERNIHFFLSGSQFLFLKECRRN